MTDPCTAMRPKLAAFFDGELEGDAADEVAEHIEACEACQERLAALEAVDAPLRAIEPPAVRGEEWRRCWGVIEAAIAADPPLPADPELALEEPNAAARLVRLLLPLAAAATIALAGTCVMVFHSHAAAAADAGLVALAAFDEGDTP